jgi:hypothetical protein
MFSIKEKNLINSIFLSNNTVSYRIGDMASDILNQIISEIKNSPFKFAIQLDDSTDIANLPQLIVFERYFNNTVISL